MLYCQERYPFQGLNQKKEPDLGVRDWSEEKDVLLSWPRNATSAATYQLGFFPFLFCWKHRRPRAGSTVSLRYILRCLSLKSEELKIFLGKVARIRTKETNNCGVYPSMYYYCQLLPVKWHLLCMHSCFSGCEIERKLNQMKVRTLTGSYCVPLE